jgi:hypothetical protein
VRLIEYEVVATAQAECAGVGSAAVATHLAGLEEVVLLRCVDDRGDKLTAVGDSERFRTILVSGEAMNPDGITLMRLGFPVVVLGWLRSRPAL